MRGKKAKQLRVDRTAEREALRRKQRQQTLFTLIVIAILVGIGGVLIFVSMQPADLASENPSDAPDNRPVACGGEKPANAGEPKPDLPKPDNTLEENTDYGAVITTTCGEITVDLDEERSPETVNNFVYLAQEGYFDGLEIFRNATSIGALQTGSGTNEASGGVTYNIEDELESAEEDGYPPGTLAMANAGAGTAGSQFFFVYNENFQLDPSYAAFGTADSKGQKVLAKIGEIPVVSPDGSDPEGAEKPTESTYIESVEITTE